MDPRLDLVNRMDQAAAAADAVRLVALGRLNWRLIDQEMLAATGQRVAVIQQQQASWNQQMQVSRARQQLADERFNSSIGQAAIAIGDNPSKYMVNSSSGWGGGAPAQDPRLQMFASVHQLLMHSATLRGAPDPQVSPGVAMRAHDILTGRMDMSDAVKLAVDSLPAEQRMMVKMLSAVPFLGKAVLGPMVRANAAAALPLDQLYRLVPDALLPNQPQPVQTQPSGAAVATGPAMMRALFARAMSTSSENTDAAFVAAIDAAARTPTIDDDISVLQELSRASGNQVPSEAVVRRAELLVSSMAQRTERRDDVALLLAWIARMVIARGLAAELAPRVLQSVQAMLRTRLEGVPAVTLAAATCEVHVALGKPEMALAFLDGIASYFREPYRQQLFGIRTAVANAKPHAPDPVVRSGLVAVDVRAALGGSLVWEDWRGDFAAAARLLEARPDPIARALVLALSGRAGAAMREVQELAQSNDIAAMHVFRYAQRLNCAFMPGGDAGMDVYMRHMQKRLVIELPRGPASEIERVDRTTLAEMLEVLPLRTTISIRGRRDDVQLREVLGTTMQESFDSRVMEKASRSPVWAALTAADLHRRDGNLRRARELLGEARRRAEGDEHAAGEIALVEGHWAACAVESPLTLGLCLEGSDNLESAIDDRVERRERTVIPPQAIAAANQAYDSASRAFASSPRGLAIATLARAGVAALANDHAGARSLAAQAERGFAAVGDDFGRFLARTHVAIASTATRTGFDRALIREIGTWGVTDGSLSFTIGCARLLSRSGRRALLRDGDVERALALHDLACELLGATSLDMLTAQAHADSGTALQLANELDRAADQFERAATRLTNATLGEADELLPRRAKTLFKLWQLHDQRASADGLEGTAVAIRALLPDLEKLAAAEPMSDAMLTMMLVSRTVAMSPARIALYRARDLANDPTSTQAGRTAAWEAASEAARAAPAGEREQFEALVEIGRGDFTAASLAFGRRFAQSTSLPASPLTEQHARQQDALELTCFLLARDPARARAAYDRLATRDADWVSHFESPWVQLGDVAALFEAEDNLDEAAKAYARAIAFVEARRGRLTQDTLKRNFVDTSPIHAMYVGAARVASDPARAFELVERGRARALLDLTWDGGRGASARRSHEARYGLLQELLAVERGKEQPSAARVDELRAQLAQLDATRPPAGAERIAPIASLDDVTRELAADQVVLQYAFADDVMMAWALTRAGMTTRHRAAIQSAELRRNALAFRAECDAGGDIRASGRYLSRLLIEPFADEIRKAKHVVVIPTDALHVVPFHALPFDDRFLIDAAAFSYAPSVSVAGVLGRGPVENGTLLAVGDPENMRDGCDALRPLPGAAVEARRVVDALRSSVPPLLGAAATARAVLEVIQTARYIHLGTHGLLSSRSPWLSTIALANGESLDLATLGTLDLEAELVTLSACNTARGSVGKSDEVLGFARALVAAGARRVLVSLWPVSDVATCELMTVFYRELARGAAPPHALRAAQQHVRTLDVHAVATLKADHAAEGATGTRRDFDGTSDPATDTYAHPTFWAPFVLISR